MQLELEGEASVFAFETEPSATQDVHTDPGTDVIVAGEASQNRKLKKELLCRGPEAELDHDLGSKSLTLCGVYRHQTMGMQAQPFGVFGSDLGAGRCGIDHGATVDRATDLVTDLFARPLFGCAHGDAHGEQRPALCYRTHKRDKAWFELGGHGREPAMRRRSSTAG